MEEMRMLPVKNDHTGIHKNLTCQWCNDTNKKHKNMYWQNAKKWRRKYEQPSIMQYYSSMEIADQILQVLSELETSPTEYEAIT